MEPTLQAMEPRRKAPIRKDRYFRLSICSDGIVRFGIGFSADQSDASRRPGSGRAAGPIRHVRVGHERPQARVYFESIKPAPDGNGTIGPVGVDPWVRMGQIDQREEQF
ncbi:MAG: hypothetical protein JWN86_2255 [Planctomycetota bacterium]|nr:hypothetical protein [Planctomycetota bacterium]